MSSNAPLSLSRPYYQETFPPMEQTKKAEQQDSLSLITFLQSSTNILFSFSLQYAFSNIPLRVT